MAYCYGVYTMAVGAIDRSSHFPFNHITPEALADIITYPFATMHALKWCVRSDPTPFAVRNIN